MILLIIDANKMTNSQTVYEKAITTHRTADTLARVHGFGNVVILAESLPPGARILDVGAGASSLGREVASHRPDVAWTNFDYSYFDPAILSEVTSDGPSNVDYIAGDATELEKKYEPESFDAIFSYWLMPHLSIDEPAPARTVARAIYRLGKPTSFISIGPRIGKGRAITIKAREAYHVRKEDIPNENTFTETIVNETQLRGKALRMQRLANEIATPFFGTSRYVIQKGKIPHVFHPGSREYVHPFSSRGIRTAGGLAAAACRHEDISPYVCRTAMAAAGTLVTGIAYKAGQRYRHKH